jgi:hypothetical protein
MLLRGPNAQHYKAGIRDCISAMADEQLERIVAEAPARLAEACDDTTRAYLILTRSTALAEIARRYFTRGLCAPINDRAAF